MTVTKSCSPCLSLGLSMMVLLLLVINNASAYVFEFSFSIEGPPNSCDKRDMRKIMHGLETLLDEQGNHYLREEGYTGFLDRLEVFLNEKPPTQETNLDVAKYGPYWGEGRCTSCPKADADSYFFRSRRGLAGSATMSKQRLMASMNQALNKQLPFVVADRGSSECAASADMWKAEFVWH